MTVKDIVSIKNWSTLDEESKIKITKHIAATWKKIGFPFYTLTEKEQNKEFAKLQNYDCSNVIEGNLIKQTMHGLALAWSYFPKSWEVQCSNMMTPMEIWNSEELFFKALKKRLSRGGFYYDSDGLPGITASSLRKGLKTFSGTQSVSNFRPTAAAAIYNKYAGDGIVYDMSCGYGGRLLGAIISNKVKRYIGTDPSSEITSGLKNIKAQFGNKEIELHQVGSEDFISNEKVDLCFTSPPYFNTEKYSVEPTQSYIKFSTLEEWKEGFLRQTIANCYESLKLNGYLILNVANVKSYKTFEADTLEIAQDEGFVLIDTLNLMLSNISKGGYKTEPIFVFQKFNQIKKVCLLEVCTIEEM